jgi:hypothetical protein
MPLSSLLRRWAAILLAACLQAVHATPAPLATGLTLTHIAQDRWRADYSFAEPVSAIELGAPAGPYRKQAWHILTPGVTLAGEGDAEFLRSTAPLRTLSVEVQAYGQFSEGQYSPIDRFSDGGWNFYLGFLYGSAGGPGAARPMDVTLALRGLPGETVIAPSRPGTELEGYAYFGPQKPVRVGMADVIVDPQAPAWLRETVLDTSAKVSQYYESALGRSLRERPLIAVAVVDFEGVPGSLNIKGGAVGGAIAYRMAGRGLVEDHPKKRVHIARLVAHEMAHLWQMNVSRGGVGGDQPWVHEGGAEALMLEAVRATGIVTPESASQYGQALLDECARLKGDVHVYRGYYACGYTRFHAYPMAPVPLWRAMLRRTEESGEVYSEAMIRALVAGAP